MFSRAQFEAWLAIEVDPRVTAYCERPAMFRRKEQNIAPDFWRCDEAGESFICIGEDDWPDTLAEIPVRRITPADLAARRQWITNWTHMLPLVITTRNLQSRQQVLDVRRFITQPMPLARIERELVTGDPTPLRGIIFRMLAAGHLTAPSLHTEPLSLLTPFSPAP